MHARSGGGPWRLHAKASGPVWTQKREPATHCVRCCYLCVACPGACASVCLCALPSCPCIALGGFFPSQSIEHIAKYGASLTDLSLCNLPKFETSAAVALARGCPALRSLDLAHCDRVDQKAVREPRVRAGVTAWTTVYDCVCLCMSVHELV